MRVAPKVVILVRDADGLGPAIADALCSKPSSEISREVSQFQLSLEKYRVKEREASGDLIHFLDHDGSPQTSIILLPNYEPPVAACAVNEILASIVSDNSSEPPIIIIPFFLPSQKIVQNLSYPRIAESGVAVFGIGIGLVTESTQAMLAGIPKPPPSLRVNCETLACLLQMIWVKKMPALVIGTTINRQSTRDEAQNLQGINEIGEFVAKCTGLCFSRDKICWREGEKSRAQEPWRALYG